MPIQGFLQLLLLFFNIIGIARRVRIHFRRLVIRDPCDCIGSTGLEGCFFNDGHPAQLAGAYRCLTNVAAIQILAGTYEADDLKLTMLQ